MNWHGLIKDHPELTIFASILVGHLIGKIKMGHFSLGAVVGTLLAGLAIGIYTLPEIPEIVRWAFFDLFLFAIGYSVGPQFFSSLKKSALPQIFITVVVNVGGLLATIACGYALKFDSGTTAGILSGALTQSAALGTGISAIQSLSISDVEKTHLTVNVPIADAMTYIFGDLGLILILIVILPALFKINLKKESATLEASLKQNSTEGSESFFKTPHKETIRAYIVKNPNFIGKTIAEVEKSFRSNRVFVNKLKRDQKLIDFDQTLKLQEEDIVTLAGWRSGFIHGIESIGIEVANDEMLAVETFERKIFVTNKSVIGMTLGKLAEIGRRGLFLRKITRGQVELPLVPNLELHRGDVLFLLGSTKDLDRATRNLGFAESDSKKSDLAFIGFCICIGIIFGLFNFRLDEIPLGLGASGSILVVGLAAGWLQKRFPKVGSIPESAQQILIDIGLIVFIAVVGLKAGPHAVEAIKTGGIGMVLKIVGAGVIVTLTGPILGFLLGYYILRQNAATILAAIGGAQTTMPTLNALQDASESKVLATYFTLPYALGNILLTLWGPVIVAVSRLWQ